MKRTLYIFFIAIFSNALLPSVAAACKVKVEKSCCKMEKTNSGEKDCCKKSDAHSKDKADCSGKYGEKSCLPSTFHFNGLTTIYQENNFELFNSAAQKQKFSCIKTDLSSGFYSIWSPPNIS